jgi:hypothetical protein
VGLAAGAIAAGGIVGVTAVALAVAGSWPAASRPAVTRPAPLTAREQIDGWIAYSTAPANGQQVRGASGGIRYLQGSDVYLARPGTEPRLVAGRGDGTTWNVCPAFSPDGTMLAFGARSPKRRAIRIVGVTRTGAVVAPRITLPVEGRGEAPCPRWSADGSRVAYLEKRRVVVRKVDGSFRRRRAGEPAVVDFRRTDRVLSPTGDRVARLEACGVTVARPDGSDARDLDVSVCPYAVAGWSPDGRKLLLMYDVSGFHFTMSAVPVDAPREAVAVAVAVRVNHPRSWPRSGDVSWQPDASP